jgi:enoyl-CoA hydratase/carnithine racemase
MQRSHILSKSALRKAISPRQQRGLHDLKPLREVHAQFLDMVRDQGAGEITFEIDNRIGEIKLRNAKKRNAMSGKMMNDLANIVDEIVPEKSLPCKYDITGLILTGEGDDAFCAGADFHLIKTIVNTSEKGGIMSEFMTDCLERIRQSGVVSLCHINGSAHGKEIQAYLI